MPPEIRYKALGVCASVHAHLCPPPRRRPPASLEFSKGGLPCKRGLEPLPLMVPHSPLSGPQHDVPSGLSTPFPHQVLRAALPAGAGSAPASLTALAPILHSAGHGRRDTTWGRPRPVFSLSHPLTKVHRAAGK